jgi:competence protein ComEA
VSHPTSPSAPPARPAPGAPTPDPEFWGGESRHRRDALPRPGLVRGADSWRNRLEDWRADSRIGVALMVLVAIIAGVVWYRVGVSGGSEPNRDQTSTVGEQRTRRTPSTTAATDTDVVVVHVAGAVTQPGVVELPAGSRVIDAIEAAGGALANADLDRLNLAAKLSDGQRVLVQRVGDPLTTEPGAETGVGDVDGAKLNLNTATTEQLEELPGIGPTLAAAIIDERERRGGFRSVNELRDVRGIGEKRFADLRDRVTV